MLFEITVCEYFGLLLSPVIGIIHFASKGYHRVLDYAWKAVENRCAISLNSSSVLETEKNADSFFVHFCRPFLQRSFDYNTDGETLTWLDYLDYEQYPAVSSFVDYLVFKPLFTPLWVLSITYRSAGMYLSYYFGDGAAKLPANRRACLLRNGMLTAQKELKRIDALLEESDKIRKFGLAIHGTSSEKRDAWSKRKNGKSEKTMSGSVYFDDFGADNKWESVINVCMENSFSGYSYKFCFFDTIFQERQTVLGKFTGWGKFDDTLISENAHKSSSVTTDVAKHSSFSASIVKYLMISLAFCRDTFKSMIFSFSNVIAYIRASQLIPLVRDKLMPLALRQQHPEFEFNAVSPDAAVTHVIDRYGNTYYKYSFMRYEDGAACEVIPGKKRRALVKLTCAASNQLVDVTEIEVRRIHVVLVFLLTV